MDVSDNKGYEITEDDEIYGAMLLISAARLTLDRIPQSVKSRHSVSLEAVESFLGSMYADLETKILCPF